MLNPAVHETKFTRTYTDLCQRIQSGRMPAGSPFPSVRQLREMYQIGHRTAREVTHRMAQEGYIQTSPRKAPVVCWRRQAPANDAALLLLRSRSAILDVYQALALVMPPLLSFCVEVADLSAAPSYERALRAARRGPRPADWRITSQLCQEIFALSGNSFYSDIFTAFVRHSCIAVFMEEADTPLAGQAHRIQDFLAMLQTADPARRTRQLTAHFAYLAQGVQQSIQALAAGCPALPAPQAEPFSWDMLYDTVPVYLQIMQDLVHKIYLGVYPVGEYLPTEGDLAAAYGVTVTTLRKALAQLRQLGYCKTYNAKGTRVLPRDTTAASRVLQQPFYKAAALHHLYGLQALTLLAPAAAAIAAPACTPAEAQAALRTADPFVLPAVLTMLQTHLEPAPLRDLLTGAVRRLRASFHYIFDANWQPRARRLNRLCQQACESLAAGDTQGFARQLFYCCQEMLNGSRQHLLRKYHVAEAAFIPTPQAHHAFPEPANPDAVLIP